MHARRPPLLSRAVDTAAAVCLKTFLLANSIDLKIELTDYLLSNRHGPYL